MTVRKTPRNDEIQFDHVLLTFVFDTAVTLTGIELELFFCPEWGIGAPMISVYADVKSNLVFTDISQEPFQSSCSSLSNVSISLGDSFKDTSYLTWHIVFNH